MCSWRPGYQISSAGSCLPVIGVLRRCPVAARSRELVARSIFGLVYLILVGSVIGYTAYAWLLGERADRDGLDLRVR